MAISSEKKRIYNFSDDIRKSFKAARDQKIKETGNDADAQRAYARAYYAKCRQVDKERAVIAASSPTTIIQITPTHVMEAQTTQRKSFEKKITKIVAATISNQASGKSAFQSVPVKNVPVQLVENPLVSYWSDGGFRYISNLNKSELHAKTEQRLKDNSCSRSRYQEVERSILAYSLLDFAPEEKALNQKVFDEILLPEYVATTSQTVYMPGLPYSFWADNFCYEDLEPLAFKSSVRRENNNTSMDLQNSSVSQISNQFDPNLLTCSDLSFELKCDEN